jgi:hypothetical protein
MILKYEKKQLMNDLKTLRIIIEKDPQIKYRITNYPQRPEETPLTLITRSIRLCRRIKPV